MPRESKWLGIVKHQVLEQGLESKPLSSLSSVQSSSPPTTAKYQGQGRRLRGGLVREEDSKAGQLVQKLTPSIFLDDICEKQPWLLRIPLTN